MFGSIQIWQYVVVSCSVLQLLAPGTVSVLGWIYLSVCVGYVRIYVCVCAVVRVCMCSCVCVCVGVFFFERFLLSWDVNCSYIFNHQT